MFLTLGWRPLPLHGAAHQAQAGWRGGPLLLVHIHPIFITGYNCTLVHRYPLHKQIGDVTEANKETPFLQAHGDCDPVVPYKWGQLTSQKLREILPRHEFKSYKVRKQR